MGWRFAHPAPPLPAGTPGWEELGSKVVQTLFYVLMIGLPLTGLLALPRRITQHPEISGISLFGLFPIPRMDLAIGLPWGGLHSIGSNIGIALLVLHVAAALKHQFWDGDGVLMRMLPHR